MFARRGSDTGHLAHLHHGVEFSQHPRCYDHRLWYLEQHRQCCCSIRDRPFIADDQGELPCSGGFDDQRTTGPHELANSGLNSVGLPWPHAANLYLAARDSL